MALNLDSIRIEVGGKDISKMVTGVTLYESIFGLLRGAIAVKDGVNFFDNFIGSTLEEVNVAFSYIESEYNCGFQMDGISNMKIDKQQKNYIIHVQSVHTPVFAQRVNSMYSGTSDEIIEQVFRDISAEQAELIIDNTCDTSGRYIAPNITAREALAVLVNNAYDNEKTGMFLYERLVDQTALRLTSLSGMFNNNFVDSGGDPVSVKSTSVDMETNFVDIVGTANSFELKEYNMDFIQKLEDGVYGEEVNVINLDETTRVNNVTKEYTSIPKTKFKLSNKLYDENVKSIFSTRGDVAVSSIVNHKIREFNTAMEVTGMVALPNLGVGMSIDIQLGGGNTSSSKQDGVYIIKHIQHNFTQDGGEYSYSQNLGLARN